MFERRVGLHVQEATPRAAVEAIVRAEQLGIGAVWTTTGGPSPDGLTLLAAAAARTSSIHLGTSIVPTYPRHPLVMAQQALVVADLARGRFSLGVGPSHRATIERTYGLEFARPLVHLREYLTVLRQALRDGRVDFDGDFFHAHGWQIASPPDVPILLSALRPASYRLAGYLADGAISWISPASYLRAEALPALQAGARQRVDGQQPVLVAHCFAAVTTDAAAVRQAAGDRLRGYLGSPFYQEMLAAAGFPQARQGIVTDEMIEAIVAHGDEATTERAIRRFLDAGADHVIVSMLPMHADADAVKQRTITLLARMSS